MAAPAHSQATTFSFQDRKDIAIALAVGIVIGAVVTALVNGLSAKIFKRKPPRDEEHKETISNEEPGEETTPDDEHKETISNEEAGKKTTPTYEPKKKTILDEECRDETNPVDEPKKEIIRDEESGVETTPDDEHKETVAVEESGDEANLGAELNDEASPGVALVGIPACRDTLGFTGAGIAAGSIAAKGITAAAIADGGGMAVLQLVGGARMSRDNKTQLTSALSKVGVASGFRMSKRIKAKIKDKNPYDKLKKKELG